MAKFVNDSIMDEALNRVKNNGVQLAICAGQPVNYSEATTNVGSTVPGGGTARRLGNTAITSTDFTGPVNGDVSGRKLTTNQQTGINIDVSGTADHIAVVTSSTASELLTVTTISNSQAVTSGNTATVNAYDHEIQDAS